MDLVAGLHWLHENLPAFNGDPKKVTLMGHNTGAALANILIVSPVASGKYLLIPSVISLFGWSCKVADFNCLMHRLFSNFLYERYTLFSSFHFSLVFLLHLSHFLNTNKFDGI